ncbi:HAD family phosphatase [Winogradskyella sp. SYSU M77433]|uniref:HAD family hydrolase n=1 Tax=Winogradskyella sp. SYSU M77433 TaxID=3042722 RepID=UPI002480824C|nr:HAD family phosphatase [Winogradskyella sp. SYSU M77433]MDH7914053.1 HAD family phosphatase [Winogradskyella sp. SYSU M77433]
MINTLIFDFGDVFINLDKKGAMQNALTLFQLEEFDDDMIQTNIQYEIGRISTNEFIAFYSNKFPNLSEKQIIDAWNFIIKDFPKYRLDFLKALSKEKKYKLILLSNTNHMHIDYVKSQVDFFDEFKNCFDIFYLSQEIHLRKPNADIYEFVLSENNLNPQECFFVDDTKENTDTANKLGINVWNIDETKEDVINLFEINKHIF